MKTMHYKTYWIQETLHILQRRVHKQPELSFTIVKLLQLMLTGMVRIERIADGTKFYVLC